MITALFVGGPMNGRTEALPRPFPTHAFRMYQPKAKESFLNNHFDRGVKPHDTHCLELTYELDLKNFEPYVYVLKGLRGEELERAHKDALDFLAREPYTIRGQSLVDQLRESLAV